MFTLSLSTLIGIITGLIPTFFSYLEKRQQYKYDIEIAKLHVEATAKGLEIQKQIEEIRASAIETKAVYDNDTAIDTSTFIGKLRGSVRPVITYVFLIFFLIAKIAFAFAMWNVGLPLEKIIVVVMDEFTLSMFGTIIGFWFGQRSSQKYNSVTKTKG